MRAMDLGVECGAKIFVLWGGREGVETDGCRRADEAVKTIKRSAQLPVRVFTGSEVRLQACARSKAERTAC
jgi:xylose isomerase